ncbi:aminoglycoside phosphotransferase family protein [Streptomyces sp. NRRL F-5126]|uniref:aminoglycoside phosphotransferase family protein n=1 Tax=Streptomyces sp. NRRL F-5126 TaxID=1463857 RepID=UPI0004C549C7|nr:aminoglycoside phosphotransferase family protein [Streptomyces sp. NRRL F-5126]
MSIESSANGRPAIDAGLVTRLVADQFPQWAGLPVRLVDPAGSDHVIHRLGDELAVRLPRHPGAVGQAERELRWLPLLAPHLPLAVPVPLAVGEPGFGYPWTWSLARWLEGERATPDALSDSSEAATALADFLLALHRAVPVPTAADHSGEGLTVAPLAVRDRATREAIARTSDVFDACAMTGLWDAALAAPAWDRPPVWCHGDLHTGNLLTAAGRLSAVIDFGELGFGDPACDLTIAFTLMSSRCRRLFRAALGVDDATWTRGRGWALATGLNAYSHYAAVNPRVAAQTTRQITQALIG